MRYTFTEKEKKTIAELRLDFDATADLTDDQEMILLDELEKRAGFGTDESDLAEDVIQTMADQAESA